MRRSQSFTLQQYLPCTAELEGTLIWWQKLQKVNKEPPSLYIRCKQKEWKTESKVCLSISHFSKSKNPQYNFSQKPSFHLSMPVSLQNWNFDFSSPTNKRITFCRGQKNTWHFTQADLTFYHTVHRLPFRIPTWGVSLRVRNKSKSLWNCDPLYHSY